jgi:hypothetical protein
VILKCRFFFIAELSTRSSPQIDIAKIGNDGHTGSGGDQRHAGLAEEGDRKAAEQAAACVASEEAGLNEDQKPKAKKTGMTGVLLAATLKKENGGRTFAPMKNASASKTWSTSEGSRKVS